MPAAVTENVAVWPTFTSALTGCVVIVMAAGPTSCSSSVALERAPSAARLNSKVKVASRATALNQIRHDPRPAARMLAWPTEAPRYRTADAGTMARNPNSS